MADMIYIDANGKEFVVSTEPMWHQKGLQIEEGLTATNAHFNEVGVVNVVEKLLTVATPQGALETGLKSIFQTNDDGSLTGIISNVPKDFQFISPAMTTSIFDKAMNALSLEGFTTPQIETMGYLAGSRQVKFANQEASYQELATRFWFSVKLDARTINGEEMQPYLVVFAPLEAGHALKVVLTMVRVVCNNTWVWAEQNALQSFEVIHKGDAIANVETAIYNAFLGLNETTQRAEEFLSKINQVSVTQEDAKGLFRYIFSSPSQPTNKIGKLSLEDKLDKYQDQLAKWRIFQNHALKQFNGGAIGYSDMNNPNSLYGIHTTATELVTHTQGRNVFDSLMTGKRRRENDRIYNALSAYAEGNILEQYIDTLDGERARVLVPVS